MRESSACGLRPETLTCRGASLSRCGSPRGPSSRAAVSLGRGFARRRTNVGSMADVESTVVGSITDSTSCKSMSSDIACGQQSWCCCESVTNVRFKCKSAKWKPAGTIESYDEMR